METLADRVNERLKTLGISGNKLAKKMGLPYGTIQSVTSGRSRTFRYIQELADALDTTPQWLLKGIGDELLTHNAAPDYKLLRDALIKCVFAGNESEVETKYAELLEAYIRDIKNNTGYDPSADQTLGFLQGLKTNNDLELAKKR